MRIKIIRIIIALSSCIAFIDIVEAQRTVPIPYDNNNLKLNFVRTWTATAPEPDGNALTTRPLKDVKMATQYIDGLGRPLQTVVMKGSLITDPANPASSANAKDLVSSSEYDVYGREQFKYLPYAESATADGAFKLNPFFNQAAFMSGKYSGQGDTWYYNQTDFEVGSPLNRPQKAMAAGTSWVGGSRGVETKYWVNTATDAVRIWKVANVANDFGTYSNPVTPESPTYPVGELNKTISIDEHGKQVIEFKDKAGKVILKKVQFKLNSSQDMGAGIGHADWLCTYYIYDDLNNLSCVVQPRGVELLIANNWDINALNGDILNEQCFRYAYDTRNRMIKKKVPGAGEVRMVYDARDRLVLTQDANMRSVSQKKWMYTTYDELNRPVATGLITDPTNYANHGYHLSAASNSIAYPVIAGYTNEELTKTFYDNYDWLVTYSNPLPSAYDNSYNTYLQTGYSSWPYPQANTAVGITKLKNVVTGSRVKVLNTGTYLYSLTFYDENGRPIQIHGTNISGGKDVLTTQYSWAGQPLVMVQKQEKAGLPEQTSVVVTQLSYDELNRVIKTEKKLSNTLYNGNAMSAYNTISNVEYDELGQLKKKFVGSKKDPLTNVHYGTRQPLQELAYDYNIRGWMLGMNRSFLTNNNPDAALKFGFELGYDKLTSMGGQNFTAAQYNGNITGMIWKSTSDVVKRKYDFGYDAANRLLKADYKQDDASNNWNFTTMNYSVIMGDGIDPTQAYDANGNIKAMKQYGWKLGANASLIDDLTYNYGKNNNSNQLLNVKDFANLADTKLGDFRTSINSPNQTKTASTIDYTYDENGNLKKDLNKDMGTGPLYGSLDGIVYNYLNLPQTITVYKAAGAVKGTINYTYDAAGNKLKKTTVENAGTVLFNGTNYTNVTITSTTSYIGGFIYESKSYNNGALASLQYTDNLQFTGTEEGRIKALYANADLPNNITGFGYDYFLKDHLGNVRMVITEEQQQDIYPAATLENITYNGGTAINTESQYYNIDINKIVDQSVATGIPVYQNNNTYVLNNNKYSNTTVNSAKLYLLNATTNTVANKNGLGIVLKVMAGDKINIFGNSYHKKPATNYTSATNPLTIADLVSLMANSAILAPKGMLGTDISGQAGFPTSVTNLLQNQPAQDIYRPRASINWVILDEQFKYVTGGFDMVKSADATTAEAFKNHIITGIPPIAKNGYIYVYCSNESQYNVFFDNLQVIQNRGPILEETHYYPFGLTMAGISSKAAGGLENKKKYQQYEWNTDFDLDIYESFYRTYDPQIGRFLQIDPDPKFEESPYVSMGNNPVSNVDPLGDDWWDVVMATIISVADNTMGSDFRSTYQPHDAADFNNALQSADAAMLTAGTAMMVQGTNTMGGGTVLLAAGGAGLPVIVAGAAEAAAGLVISGNAAVNMSKGYNYGTKSDPIVVADKDKVPRDELNPPGKPGNAPTYKKDNKPVELHHKDQNPNGPFKEMHPKDHRGKGNDKVNHPNKSKPSKIDRKEFNKQKKEYWKKEYLPPSKVTISPQN